VLLPRRERLKHEDLSRGVVRVSLGERLLDDGPRREPRLGQVRQLRQELGARQSRCDLELGLQGIDKYDLVSRELQPALVVE
jgi:hypothetical protein